MFVHCKNVVPFWSILEQWFKQNIVQNEKSFISKRIKLLGTLPVDNIKEHIILDYILLHGKLYLYKCHRQNWRLSFIILLQYIRNEITIETLIAKTNSKLMNVLNYIKDRL